MKDTLIRLLVLTNITLLIVAAAPKKPSVLTVSELNVVDSKGVVRARIAGNLPETYSNGKPVGRGAAGVLLYDAAGVERGGYVTFARCRRRRARRLRHLRERSCRADARQQEGD